MSSKSRTRAIITVTWIIPMLLSSPYLFCHSYAFNIHGKGGSISRQICNDRFDDIDPIMFGEGNEHLGKFRKGFFLFLFLTIYLIPLLVIATTCVRIAKCLLQPIATNDEPEETGLRNTRQREENKRRVSQTNNSFSSYYKHQTMPANSFAIYCTEFGHNQFQY